MNEQKSYTEFFLDCNIFWGRIVFIIVGAMAFAHYIGWID